MDWQGKTILKPKVLGRRWLGNVLPVEFPHQSIIKNPNPKQMKEIKQYKGNELDYWKEDIKDCFIPKCSWCKRKATMQTVKGEYAEKNNHRPVNWGYYCEKCWDKGLEIEEAMYN